MNREFAEINRMIPDAMQVFDDVKGCLHNKDSVLAYCKNDKCTPDRLSKNVQSQLFKVIGSVNNIKSIFAQFPVGTSTEFFDIAF